MKLRALEFFYGSRHDWRNKHFERVAILVAYSKRDHDERNIKNTLELLKVLHLWTIGYNKTQHGNNFGLSIRIKDLRITNNTKTAERLKGN